VSITPRAGAAALSAGFLGPQFAPLVVGNGGGAFENAYGGGGAGKGGTATVSVDGKEVAKGRVEKAVPIRISLDEGLDVG